MAPTITPDQHVINARLAFTLDAKNQTYAHKAIKKCIKVNFIRFYVDTMQPIT